MSKSLINRKNFYIIQKVFLNKKIIKEYFTNNLYLDIGYNKFTLDKFYLKFDNLSILLIKDNYIIPNLIYYVYNKLKERKFNIILIDWNNEILNGEKFLNKTYIKRKLEDFLSQIPNKELLLNLIVNIIVLICDLNMSEAQILKKMVLNKILERYVERIKLKDIKNVLASVMLATTYENEVRNTVIRKIEKILNDEILSEMEIDFTSRSKEISDMLLPLYQWKNSSLKLLVLLLLLETLLVTYKKENNYVVILNVPAYIYNSVDIILKERLLKKVGDLLDLKIPLLIIVESLDNELYRTFHNYFNYIILTKRLLDIELQILKKTLNTKILNELTNKFKSMEEGDILITNSQNLIYILRPNKDEFLKANFQIFEEETIYFEFES
jgi:hypothetical protein